MESPSCGNRQDFSVTSPKPEPCKLVQGRPCTSCLELETFDREAQAILEEDRRKILAEINQCHDPFIQRLPVELASQIFAFCIPPQDHEADPRRISLLWSNSRDRIKPFNIVLGAICRAWRQVAWSTPDLWSTLPIALHRGKNKELILEWLGRSGQTPLDVFLVLDPIAASVPLTDTDIWKPLIDIANGCSSRWRTFSVYGAGLVLAYITGDGQGTCILECLKIRGAYDRSDSSRFSLTNAIPMPSQLVSSTMPLRSIDIDWSNLITIEIGELYVNEFLVLLRWAPRLTRCTLNSLEDGSDEHLPPPTPTHHHTLQELDIRMLDVRQTAEQLLNLLILPSLSSLFHDSKFNSLENVAALLDRSASRLTTFSDLNGDFHDLLVLAPHLQALERLEYPGSPVGGVQLPIRGDEIGRNIFPNLREISLQNRRIFWCLLADLILLCPLKTLTIHVEHFNPGDNRFQVDEESACRFQNFIKDGYNIKITYRLRGEKEDGDLLAWSAEGRMSQTRAAD